MLIKDNNNYCVICGKHCAYARGYAVCTADKCKVIEAWSLRPNSAGNYTKSTIPCKYGAMK